MSNDILSHLNFLYHQKCLLCEDTKNLINFVSKLSLCHKCARFIKDRTKSIHQLESSQPYQRDQRYQQDQTKSNQTKSNQPYSYHNKYKQYQSKYLIVVLHQKLMLLHGEPTFDLFDSH